MGLGVAGGSSAASPANLLSASLWAPGCRLESQGLVSVQPGRHLENPPTRLLLGPRATHEGMEGEINSAT